VPDAQGQPLAGSPTVSAARHAPPIRVSATIVRLRLRIVKATSPLVELFADGVDPPPMIVRAETFLIGHSPTS
jgi:hypothetical protein